MALSRRVFNLSALSAVLSPMLGPVLGPMFGWSSRALAKALVDADAGFAGPMVGHTTANQSSLWMYTPGSADVKVKLTPVLETGEAISKTVAMQPIAAAELELRGQPFRVELSELKPNTRYQYEVLIDGVSAAEHRGEFQTAPAAGEAGKFRLGVTSCMKIEKPQDSWPLFLAQKPDLHLTLGDSVYSDSTDPRVQWQHHLRYRQSPNFAEVIKAMPTYSLWDDHDFGPNNSDGTAKGKEDSLSGWEKVWNNPAMGTQETPGAFYKFSWGDVDFFVVDGRYHRTPDKAADDAEKTMLGDAQFKWLMEAMKSSSAKFKVIASGSPLDHSLHDGWRIYAHARHQLFDAIQTNKINGVIYLSGSLHRSLVWEHHESDRVGYPFVEVISSGIANSKRLGFATIDFDTVASDPSFTVRIVEKGGKVVDEKTYRLSTLSHA